MDIQSAETSLGNFENQLLALKKKQGKLGPDGEQLLTLMQLSLIHI